MLLLIFFHPIVLLRFLNLVIFLVARLMGLKGGWQSFKCHRLRGRSEGDAAPLVDSGKIEELSALLLTIIFHLSLRCLHLRLSWVDTQLSQPLFFSSGASKTYDALIAVAIVLASRFLIVRTAIDLKFLGLVLIKALFLIFRITLIFQRLADSFMIHYIVQACKVHSAKFANVYLALVGPARLQALVLFKAALV